MAGAAVTRRAKGKASATKENKRYWAVLLAPCSSELSLSSRRGQCNIRPCQTDISRGHLQNRMEAFPTFSLWSAHCASFRGFYYKTSARPLFFPHLPGGLTVLISCGFIRVTTAHWVQVLRVSRAREGRYELAQVTRCVLCMISEEEQLCRYKHRHRCETPALEEALVYII